MRTFHEYFAGGGMARAGLGDGWRCVFANDFDAKKVECYRANWGKDAIVLGDIGALPVSDVPGSPDLAWASFPCQDLSLAGAGGGLAGSRSGAFWMFWRLMVELSEARRAPRAIVLENVCGLLTSNEGMDFATICRALTIEKYHVGAVVVDAELFVPQSRPRLFIIALRNEGWREAMSSLQPDLRWHTRALIAAVERLPEFVREHWMWLKLPQVGCREITLDSLVDRDAVDFHSRAETSRLIGMMSKLHRSRIEAIQAAGGTATGTLYRRTRIEHGQRVQRAEVRFDGVAGCLRTPGGGSSRQTLIEVSPGRVRTRLLTPRETARLMGLPDTYRLPPNANDAYHLTGDGVVAPVVRFLAANVLEPSLDRHLPELAVG